MQISCEKCQAKYNLPDDKIKPTGTAVRCPKCSHVFKVFPTATAPAEPPTVACANCGKQTPAATGMDVVFCEACRDKIAGGVAEDNPFAGANLFGDAAANPDPFSGAGQSQASSARESLFDPAPPSSGTGLFDKQPTSMTDPFGGERAQHAEDPFGDVPKNSGGLFDDQVPSTGGDVFADQPAPDQSDIFADTPTQTSPSSLFDEGPSTPSGGGLFDEAPAAQTSGGLFDDGFTAPGSDASASLFDEPASSSQADPFGDFAEPPGQGGAATDPFDDFAEPPPANVSTITTGLETPDFSEPEAEEPPPPVREKQAPLFKKKELTRKEQIFEFLSENSAKLGLYTGLGMGAIVLILTALMAFAPGLFDARPTRPDDKPGPLSSLSFSLQRLMGTAYYGKAMEHAYVKAAIKAMASWNGAGFASAEKELNELLTFDPANATAKTMLATVLATQAWLDPRLGDDAKLRGALTQPGASPEALILGHLALGNVGEAAQLVSKVGTQRTLYAALVSQAAGQATAAVSALEPITRAQQADFLAKYAYARALQDAKQYAAAVSAFEAAAHLVKGNPNADLEIGRLYFGPLEDHEKALAALRRASDPKSGASAAVRAEALYHIAKIIHRRGRSGEALVTIQDALNLDPSNARYLAELGDIYFDTSKIVDAYNSYEKAKQNDKTLVAAWIGLGRTNERLEKLDVALNSYRQAITLDPLNARANFLYAALILKQGRKDEAERVLLDLLKRDPSNVEAANQLARFYMDQRRLDDALKIYADLIAIAPSTIDGYLGKGIVLVEAGRLHEAKAYYQRAATLAPDNPAVLFRLGQTAYLEGDYSLASKVLRQAVDRDPYHWEAHLYLGMALAAQQQYEEALTEYKKAQDVNPRAAEIYRQRGLVFLAQGQAAQDTKMAAQLFEKAVVELEQALYYDASKPDYYYDYGLCLFAAGKEGKAKDAWLKAVELRPGFNEAMFAVARYYVSFQDYTRAEATLQKVIEGDRRNPQAYLELGKTYAETGRFTEAQRALTKAIQLDPKLAEAHEKMGEVLLNLDKASESTVHFQRALQLDPKHGLAHYYLGIYFKDRDPKRARDHFKAAIETGKLPKVRVEEAQAFIRELEYIK